MRTREFEKLKIGDRVIVSGMQDDRSFSNTTGVIENVRGYDGAVTVKFDTWDRGWGLGEHFWSFYASDVRKFTLTVVPEVPKPLAGTPLVKKRPPPHGKQEYKGNGKHAWEAVIGDTSRLRVPGGWLYRSFTSTGVNTAFVPVPQAVGYSV